MNDYNLEWKEKDDIEYLTSPLLLKERSIFIAFTNRLGGASKPPHASLNLALHVGDKDQSVIENRRILSKVFDFDLKKLVSAKQVHGTYLKWVKKKEAGSGAFSYETAFDGTDALLSKENIPLILFYADCLPLIVVSLKPQAVAVIHAGFKGIYDEIIKRVISSFVSKGIDPSQLLAFIGPSIKSCCYEVGEERFANFYDKFGEASGKNNYLDLASVATQQLIASSVESSNIFKASDCTCCNSEKFFSFRNEKTTGRQAAFAQLLSKGEGGRVEDKV